MKSFCRVYIGLTWADLPEITRRNHFKTLQKINRTLDKRLMIFRAFRDAGRPERLREAYDARIRVYDRRLEKIYRRAGFYVSDIWHLCRVFLKLVSFIITSLTCFCHSGPLETTLDRAAGGGTQWQWVQLS